MDLLDYFAYGEILGNDQPFRPEQDEQDLHHCRDHQRDEKKEEIELEDEAALREDPTFS